MLNDTIPVDPHSPTKIGDYDHDGIPDLMVKFNEAEVMKRGLYVEAREDYDVYADLTDEEEGNYTKRFPHS